MGDNGLRGFAGIIPGNRSGDIPSGTKVQHLGTAAHHHNVIGLDIPVNNADLMYPCHGLNNGSKDIKGLLRCQFATVILDILCQGDAFHILHDDVCRIVGQEEILYLHNLVHVREPGQQFCFAHKPLPVVAETLAVAAADIKYRHSGAAFPHNHARGIVLLNGDRDIQIDIPAKIGNAKPALSQHSANLVLFLQNRTDWQLMGSILGSCAAAAMGAIFGSRFHLEAASAAYIIISQQTHLF